MRGEAQSTLGSKLRTGLHSWTKRSSRAEETRQVGRQREGVAKLELRPPMFREMIERGASRNDISRSIGIPACVRHARSWQQTCTLRRFVTTTDAEMALASLWQKMTIRDHVIESHHELMFSVQKPERRWTWENRRSV